MTEENKPVKYAFQGASGAFSHCAAKLYADRMAHADGVEFVPCRAFNEVFEWVVKGRSQFGVLPLENSSIGSIVTNYDLLWSSPIRVVGEVFTPIHLHLMAVDGAAVSNISDVYSHPAALDQCRKFFNKLPDCHPVAYWDTGGAALHISELKSPRMAAIASELAAQEYGLSIIKRNVEDHPYNRTRFGVIAARDKHAAMFHANPDPPYKFSCAVELSHRAGTLAALLSKFAGLEVNLSKIESRPIPEAPWHYRFFIDLELESPEQDQELVKILESMCEAYKFLGRYRPWRSGE